MVSKPTVAYMTGHLCTLKEILRNTHQRHIERPARQIMYYGSTKHQGLKQPFLPHFDDLFWTILVFLGPSLLRLKEGEGAVSIVAKEDMN